MKRRWSIVLLAAALFCCICPAVLMAQAEGEIIKDADGNTYHTVKIGGQTWMKENLKTRKFRNGEKIPVLPISTDWSNIYKPYLSDKPGGKYQPAYGRLYNWYCVADPRGLCPAGYHIPDRRDLLTLLDHTGRKKEKWSDKSIFSQGEAENIGGKLKALSRLWVAPNSGAGNESGFTALPAGYRGRSFEDAGLTAWFWSSTSYNEQNADALVLSNESSGARLTYHFKTNGFAVRCVKD